MFNCFIIGAGNKGALSDAPGTGNEKKYLSYAHAVIDHPGFNLVGFSDILPEMVQDAERIWGRYMHEKGLFNLDSVNNIDVLIIATSDESHYEYLKELAETDFKLVICEKPLTLEIDQAREIVELYRERNIPLMVDYTRRFIPKFRQFKSEIDGGKTGKHLKSYLYFNRGWIHTATHFTDMALWFNGNMDNIEITEVDADFQWLYQWGMIYEHDTISEHYGNRQKAYEVSNIYDNHLMLVMENAYQFLEGKQDLYCTGADGLRALIETERIKNVRK